MIPPVVDADWLRTHRSGVVLADVRWALGGPPGADEFAAGHLPGAVFVGLDVALAAPPSATAGRHPLPAPRDFAAAMTAAGIGDDATVVAYDDSAGSSAARLVWMLRALGRDAALLDGGLGGWDGPREAGAVAPTPASPAFTEQPWPADRIVDADTTAALAGRGVAVLDARVSGRFTGEAPLPADPRPGHVPGARSAPWQSNLDADGRFLDAEALRAHYDDVLGDEPPVVYCGSGVTACVDLLALERAGVDGARLYPGSWSQWAADDRRPVETGESQERPAAQ